MILSYFEQSQYHVPFNLFKRLMTSGHCTCFNTSTLLFPEETKVSKGEYLVIQHKEVNGNRVGGLAEIWLDKDGYLTSKSITDPSGIRVLRKFYFKDAPEDGYSSYDRPLYIVREILEVKRNERDSLIFRNYEEMKSGNSTIEYETFVVPFEEDTLVSSEPFLLHEDTDSDL